VLRKLWAFVKLTRPHFLLGGVLLYGLGLTVAAVHGASIDVGRALLGQLLVSSIQVTAHYANEYYDVEVDRLSARNRTWFSGGSGVLPTGELKRSAARRAMQICAAVALLAISVATFQNPLMGLIGSLSLLGAYFYSAPPLALMGSGWGELSTATLTALFVPLTGCVMQTGRVDASLWAICLPVVLIYVAMIIAFEFPDYPADKALGKRTLAVRLGLSRVARLHNGLLAGSFVLTFALVALNAPWPAAQFMWLAVPLALWQIIGVAWRSRSGWRGFAPLCAGAVALAALTPALWLIGYLVTAAA
jgi:1,4-dihydroxy-2-naphthoate octaprenyltransferase